MGSTSHDLSSQQPLVSVVVLNWNGLDHTLACLESLANQTYEHIEIIVADNGSEDPDDMLRLADYEKCSVRLVTFPRNYGFAGAHVRLLPYVKGEFIALLNNDAVAAPDWVATLVKRLRSDDTLGACGGRAFVWDECHAPWDRSSPFYTYQTINIRNGGAETATAGDCFKYVQSISGAAVMIRRGAVDAAGYFDESFFAYYEETDLFWRMRASGYRIGYEPQAAVWHRIAGSTSQTSSLFRYLMLRNRYYFALRNFSGMALLKVMAVVGLVWPLRVVRAAAIGSSVSDMYVEVKAWIWLVRRGLAIWRYRRNKRRWSGLTRVVGISTRDSVSVIIPCHNYGRFLDECLESVFSQTERPEEVIVVDDGSTDDSADVARRYPVRVISQRRKGVVAAKNTGFVASQGAFVLFLDADDRLAPNYIEETRRALEEDSTAFAAYTDFRYFGTREHWVRVPEFSAALLARVNFIHNSALIRRDAFEAVGGYKDYASRGFEDWDLYLALASTYGPAIRAAGSVLWYRQHGRQRNALPRTTARMLLLSIWARHWRFVVPKLMKWYLHRVVERVRRAFRGLWRIGSRVLCRDAVGVTTENRGWKRQRKARSAIPRF